MYRQQIGAMDTSSSAWRRIPFGAWMIFAAFGLLFSIASLFHLGGSITQIALVFLGILILSRREGDVSFGTAVNRAWDANRGILTLLIVYYVWIAVGCLRVGSFTISFGMDVLFMWKYYLIEWVGLAAGFLLLANPRYRRWAIYSAGGFMLLHAMSSLQQVTLTGQEIRQAMRETQGAFGVTGFWETFAMGTLLLFAYLLSERQRWIKIVGLCCLPILLRALLYCGFATPVALFLIGIGVTGFVVLRLGLGTTRKRVVAFSYFVALILILFAFVAVKQIAVTEGDARTSSIQGRFRSMLEDPRGGGYDVENSRLQWMRTGWESFKKAPFFGAGGMYMGNPATNGHHALVDYLGVYGLVGGGSYILFLLLCIRNTVLRYRAEQTWESAAGVGVVVMYLVGGVFNPCWYGTPTEVLFFYVFPFRRKYEQPRLYHNGPMV